MKEKKMVINNTYYFVADTSPARMLMTWWSFKRYMKIKLLGSISFEGALNSAALKAGEV